uniref:TolA, tolA protein n=1 Tax=Magnetospirillum gryphiswaldense TaxID=55518 RepID=A4TVV5_9PROT|nr:TolA, tolA protein [Magnetospirillum gryphiswaldense MSR-1]
MTSTEFSSYHPLDDLLKATDKAKPNTPSAEKGNQPKPQNVRGSDMHNPNAPISMTEMDRIRKHVSDRWNIPAGAKDAANLIIEIRVSVQPDGTVTDAQIINAPLMADSFWQAAADSARRAVRLASPLPIPRDKYDQFRDFVLTFNPKQMVQGR